MPTWGKTNTNGSQYTASWCRAMDGDGPDLAGMKLDSVHIYVGTTHTSQVRVGVYSGGILGDPTGATLLYDFGLTSGSGTSQWLQLDVSGDIDIPQNDVIWIAFKGNEGGFDCWASSTPGDAEDFDAVDNDGRTDSNGISDDETVVYPSTWPSESGTEGAFWYTAYITYHQELGPTITDVDTDEDIYEGQIGTVITGTAFETDGANSRVRINSASGGGGTDQTQTDTSWADTSIQFTVSKGSLSYGANYLFVRNQSLEENATGFTINLYLRHYISSTDKASFRNGDTVVLTGANFSASQGGNEKVQLMDSSDGSGTNVDQTVDSWANGEITITCVQGALDEDNNAWLAVIRDESGSGDSSPRRSAGYSIDLLEPSAFVFSLSSEFTNNDPTTRQLTLQSGQTFVAGKIVESSNPSEISLNGTNYTEVEYCIKPTTDSETGAQYEIRLVDEGQAGEKLDVYSVSSKLTIQT